MFWGRLGPTPKLSHASGRAEPRVTGCSVAAREAIFAGKDSSGPKGVGPLEIFFFFYPGGDRGRGPSQGWEAASRRCPVCPFSPQQNFFFTQGETGAEGPAKGGRLPAGDAQYAPSPISPQNFFFGFTQGETGAEGPAKGGRLPAGDARSAPSPLENNFFCVLLKSSMRVDPESGAEAPAKGGRLPAKDARSAPSPISPQKNCKDGTTSYRSIFFFFFFWFLLFLQSVNKLRKLLASRDLDTDTRMTHCFDRPVEMHPTQHQAKLKPSPSESY